MIFRVMLLFVVCGLIWFVYTQWVIHNKSSGRELSHADVGIVLGAVLWDNKPSPALVERLDHALSLYQAGHFDTFIVTGGLDHPSLRLTEAQGMAAYLIERGVPSDHILLENQATSTYENLLFSREIMKDHGYKSAVIITHRYHGARSLEIANFLGYQSPVVSTTESKVLNMAWHQMRESLAYTKWKLDQLWITIGMKG
ncbi:YdcF family protein [Paenibacillus terrigena]|uniref:YdcF family protein n=1 Tax=Paenibacillus terrigena TaxID=369333 RepID=UPI001FDF3853|nr:YdcF family protein [Paenibacillus terrigena]